MKAYLSVLFFLFPLLNAFAETITCNSPVPAYDLNDPKKQLGTFGEGSTLEMGAKRQDGLVEVTFKQGSNPPIKALCSFDALQRSSKMKPPGQFGRSTLYSGIVHSLVDGNLRPLSPDRKAKLASCRYVFLLFGRQEANTDDKISDLKELYSLSMGLPEAQTEVIFLSLDENADKLKKHATDAKMPWLMVQASSLEKSPLQAFNKKVYPQLVLLGEKGELLSDSAGDGEKSKAAAVITHYLTAAKPPGTMTLTLESAFRLSQLEEAKKKAMEEKKPLGFIVVWDACFNVAGTSSGDNSSAGLVHFYETFNHSCVLVFVRHEDEMHQVPPKANEGYHSSDAGGFSPKMAVLSADTADLICMIPLGIGSDGHTNREAREKVFTEKKKVMEEYLSKKNAAAPAKEEKKP
jgi:hypothetical protein